AAMWVEPVDGGGQLELRLLALVIHQDAITRVGKPDRAIRMYHDIVGRVQPLALVAVDQHRDATIVLGAGDAAGEVPVGDQPTLPIARFAVAVMRRRTEDADSAGLLAPAHHAVVGDVAPQQVAAIAKPDRALGPAKPGREPLHLCTTKPVLRETW